LIQLHLLLHLHLLDNLVTDYYFLHHYLEVDLLVVNYLFHLVLMLLHLFLLLHLNLLVIQVQNYHNYFLHLHLHHLLT
jgi:hypothetical protein